MHIGDVVTYKDKLWAATSLTTGRLCVIRTWDGEETEVPQTFEKDPESGLKVVAEPGKWPFLTAPLRTKDGPLIRVTIVRANRQRELVPLVDWAPSGMLRPGGPVYFSPALRLEQGEVLVATYRSGKMARLTVNAAFASVKRRQQRALQANLPPVRRTVYDRLMADDDDFEDT